MSPHGRMITLEIPNTYHIFVNINNRENGECAPSFKKGEGFPSIFLA